MSQDDTSHPEPHVDDESTQQLVLVKRGQRYVFRYVKGQESTMLSGLIEMVRNGNSDLDWFDAAVLSYQIGQRMSQDIHNYLKP